MWRSVGFAFVCFLQYAVGSSQLCGNDTELSCTAEILGENRTDYDTCRMKVYPADSHECRAMSFGSLSPNTHIGGVTLKPYIMTKLHTNGILPYYVNHTVLNITFENIKWTTMKFRFQDKYRDNRNHCRNIMISNDVRIDDQSVLFYDCYWPKTDNKDGQSHTLDFEAATDSNVVNRGKYYFNIPSADMLSPSTPVEKWKPFTYIEIFPTIMRLRIMPPPPQLRPEITAYHIKVVTACKDTFCNVKSTTINLNNSSKEVTYDFNFVGSNGSFSFVVTPLHKNCDREGLECQSVESPRIFISSDGGTSTNICIASVTALVVATLFAYYVVLRVVRKYCCKDIYKPVDTPMPPKILVVYSSANRVHAGCVASLVQYLRAEYGFDIMFDGDISATSHGDPFIWAQEAFRLASHIIYVVGPAQEANIFNNIYDKPIISPHKDVDTLLLSFIKTNRGSRCPKEIINIFFEHSNGPVPIETSFAQVKFKLIKEWNAFISYLSKDLLPKRQIMRTEKGKSFIEELIKAKTALCPGKEAVIVQC